MTKSDQISDAIGHPVIARKEGSQLGGVAHVFFDPDKKTISGMTLRPTAFGKESWFGVEEIELIGRDVILLKGEASLTPCATAGVVTGKSLKEMRGMRVVTTEGKLLGTLEDLEVLGYDWSISELYLDKNQRLSVDSADITIGPDQIMVPAGYIDRLVEEPKGSPGFLRRVFSAKEE